MSSFVFVNQFYWPDEAATAQLLRDLCEDLVAYGHHVTVVCGTGKYSCKEELAPGSFEMNGVRIERVQTTDCGRFRWQARVMDGISFLRSAKKRLEKLERPDAVVVMTSPPLVGTLGVRYFRRTGVPFFLWSQDIYPEVAERLGALPFFLRGIVKRKADKIYQHSKGIIVPGFTMQQTLERRGVNKEKIHVIPNWADVTQFPWVVPIESSARQKHGWKDECILMYSGNLGLAHEVDAMAELVADLMERMGDSFRFVLVGDSPRHVKFIQKLKDQNLERFTHLPFQPRNALADVLCAADAHLISQREEVLGLLVPSKFYGVVAAARPVIFIGPKNSEIGQEITTHNLGVVLEKDSIQEGISRIMSVLLSIRADPQRMTDIRTYANENAWRGLRTQQFMDILLSGQTSQ
jgi:colanic acid biosynthesis glycosyl transferase WcaI